MTAPPQGRRLARSIGGAAAAKILVMGLSGVLGILTSRMIISGYGTEAYAQYGLLATIPTLLPFVDLGIAAVVLNTVAGSDDPRNDPVVRRTIVTAFRVLLVSGAALGLAGVVISLFDAWPLLLGSGIRDGGGETAALLSLLIFGAVLPLTVAQRVLIGLNRTTTQVAAQAVVAPAMFLAVVVSVSFALPVGDYLAVFSYLANPLASVICLIIVARLLSPQLGLAIREIPRLKSVRSVRFMDVAWPSLAQMLVIPIALQTDRLLLSHLSTSEELAEYNLAAQLFGLALQTIVAAGVALWPVFARARATSTVQSPAKLVLWFLLGGLMLSGGLAVLSPWIVAFISDGRIVLDGWLVVGFVLFIATQAANYPLGMYMTDKRGLRFQVPPIMAMLPLNLGLSWVLIGELGAGGTILASAISVTLCQVLPNALYVRRDLRRRRREAAAGEAAAADALAQEDVAQ